MHLPDHAPERARDDAARVRFRRALTLLVMTLVLPGSAQLVAGSRRVGRIALRVAATTVVLVGLLALLGYLSPASVVGLLSHQSLLVVMRFALMLLAVGWAGLFVDAWRLGQPLGLDQRQRLAVVGVNGLLCFSTAGVLLFGAHVVGVQRDFLATVFSQGEATAAHAGRFNVLLLGGDSGADRWGLRPDSLTIASIDAESGRTVLFGLPRNMADFDFAPGSVMHEQFPDGFDCEGCYLNSLATWGRDNKELFGDLRDPGIEATIEGVEGITGLRLNYYAMVNLRGFRNLVDAVGGLRLNVRQPIPIGGIGSAIDGYIEPGKGRLLDGFETLWFARSRAEADDYSRMARQKCVMGAMVDQLDPQTVITNFEALADASKAMVMTNLPASELSTFVPLALQARTQPIRTVSFVPPMVDTAAPDIEKIHQRVQKAIEATTGEASRATPSPRPTPGGPADGPDSVGGSLGSFSEGYAANESADLDSVC